MTPLDPSPLSHQDSGPTNKQRVTMNLHSHQWKISLVLPFLLLLLLLLELLKLKTVVEKLQVVDLGTLGAQHVPINSLLQHPLNCNCSREAAPLSNTRRLSVYKSGWCYLTQYRRSCTRMSR